MYNNTRKRIASWLILAAMLAAIVSAGVPALVTHATSSIKLALTYEPTGANTRVTVQLIDNPGVTALEVQVPVPAGTSFVSGSGNVYVPGTMSKCDYVAAQNVVKFLNLVSMSNPDACIAGENPILFDFVLTGTVSNVDISFAGGSVKGGEIINGCVIVPSVPVDNKIKLAFIYEAVGDNTRVTVQLIDNPGVTALELNIPIPAGSSFVAGSAKTYVPGELSFSDYVPSQNVVKFVNLSSFSDSQACIPDTNPILFSFELTGDVSAVNITIYGGELIGSKRINGYIIVPPITENIIKLGIKYEPAGANTRVTVQLIDNPGITAIEVHAAIPAGSSYISGTAQTTVPGAISECGYVAEDNAVKFLNIVSFSNYLACIEGVNPVLFSFELTGSITDLDITFVGGGIVGGLLIDGFIITPIPVDNTVKLAITYDPIGDETTRVTVQVIDNPGIIALELHLAIPTESGFVEGSDVAYPSGAISACGFNKSDNVMKFLYLASFSNSNAHMAGTNPNLFSFELTNCQPPLNNIMFFGGEQQ
ncbi:MAG: hypothetical protein FWD16_01690, partial [Clostridia bacterium]|nr:hypothetical protein [Clostridia bacterium]